ncbi:MAG: septum formation protein Maf [Robiginitomaculum sp.]|nr:MAG: septum formation protein Maf [Robiginitomaculum sp.]
MSGSQLVLASSSFIRKQILTGAGLKFEVRVGDVDEDEIKQSALAKNKTPAELATLLALAKAQYTPPRQSEFIIGADQLLEMDGGLYDKPKSMAEAKTRLLKMRGREHRLVGAVVVVEDGQAPWVHVSTTRLFMRTFSEAFLDTYLQSEGEDLLKSVGAYMFEARGAQLFDWVKGDFYAILGLPLLPLLGHLRERGAVPS